MKRLGLLFVVLLSACNLSPVNNDGVNPQADFWLGLGGEVDKILTSRAMTPAIAVDPQGQPVVAWQESPSTSYDIYVKRWNKAARRWDNLGAKLDNSSLQNAIEPDVAVDLTGNLVVTWSEFSNSSYNIYVKRWLGGSTWQKIGEALDVDLSKRADQPTIAITKNGSPFIAWRENSRIHAKFWDGSNWISLGQVSSSSLPASLPTIALDTRDIPIVSWLEKGQDNKNDAYVRKWNGSSWQTLVTPHDTVQDVTGLSLTTDSSNVPVVAMVLDGHLTVKRLRQGVWQTLGDVLDINPANNVFSPSISADQTGKLYVAWSELEGSNYNVHAKSWDGSWQSLGATLDVSTSKKALSPTLATTSTGQVFVGWQEYSGALNREDIRVRQWRTKSWQPLGSELDTVLKNSIGICSIDIDKSGAPIMAWIESGSNIRSLYVKRWNGNNWVQLGEKLNSLNSLGLQVLKINHLGHIYVAYFENSKLVVKRWKSGTWQAIGSAIPNVSAVDIDLAFTSGGSPVVLYAYSSQLWVKRWNGTAWINWGKQVNQGDDNYPARFELGISGGQPFVLYIEQGASILKAKTLNTSSWESLENLSIGNSDYYGVGFDMSIDQSGHPVVAFQGYANGDSSIYVKRWKGGNWISLGSALDISIWRNTFDPSLDIDPSGNPVVAWQETMPLEYYDDRSQVFVKRWNGSRWILVGDGIFQSVIGTAYRPVIAMKPDNNPVVGWQESNNLYVSGY